MSTGPESMAAAPPVSKSSDVVKQCLSCRMLSGGGLIAAGVFVAHAAKSAMRAGVSATMGSRIQLMFAAGLSAWGLFIIADPARTPQEKSSTD